MKSLAVRTAVVLATFSLATMPAVAGPASPAQKLSLARATTHAKHANGIAGTPVVALAALAAFVAGTVIVVNSDHKNPRSP